MSEDAGDKIMLGWREYVSLPEWRIPRVRAKIDTGARTSAIHVAAVERLDDGRLRFEVVIRERPRRKSVWVEADPVREANVKPSSGRTQRRPVVCTRLQLGGVDTEVELSLVSRKGMLCRLLVGRTALQGRFVVDPERRYVASERRPRRGEPKRKKQ